MQRPKSRPTAAVDDVLHCTLPRAPLSTFDLTFLDTINLNSLRKLKLKYQDDPTNDVYADGPPRK